MAKPQAEKQELGHFNMASKPTAPMSTVDVEMPNVGISGGRTRGWDGGEHPSTENKKKPSTTSEEKTKVEKQERHGRLGDNDFSCSFCGHQEHRSGDCPERLGKLLAQGVRGLLRIAEEDFLRSRTTEIIEAAKKKQAARRRPQQRAGQQQRTASRTAKPAGEIEDKGAGEATAVQTAAGKQQEEETRRPLPSSKKRREEQPPRGKRSAKRKGNRKEER